MSSSSTDVNALRSPVVLPVSGCKFPNRLFKSAMTECLADPATQLPNAKHFKLYARWADSGCGVLVTGNVMVSRDYCESPANVALEAQDAVSQRLSLFREWALAMKKHGSVAVMQLSHSGRQTPMSVSWQPVAPSAVSLKFKGLPSPVAPVCRPRALTVAEIEDIKQRFVTASVLAERAGFDGVQLHSAHGYLLSEFLSPLVNRRSDAYGGSGENRQRLLLEILRAVRSSCGKSFIVGVKLNSSDFDKGGFDENASLNVIRQLKENGIDFVEISGGTYEAAEFVRKVSQNPSQTAPNANGAAVAHANGGVSVRESTARREAYFIDFAVKVRSACPDVVLVLTGGWRHGHLMNSAIQKGEVDVIGLARPLCVDPDFPKRLLSANYTSDVLITTPFYDLRLNVGIADTTKTVESLLENFWHQANMREMVADRAPSTQLWANTLVRVWHVISYTMAFYYWSPRRNLLRNRVALGLLAAAALYFFKRRYLQL